MPKSLPNDSRGSLGGVQSSCAAIALSSLISLSLLMLLLLLCAAVWGLMLVGICGNGGGDGERTPLSLSIKSSSSLSSMYNLVRRLAAFTVVLSAFVVAVGRGGRGGRETALVGIGGNCAYAYLLLGGGGG